MPVPSTPPVWWGSLLWLVGVAAAAFLVAWASGTRLHIRRTPYIAILTVLTGALCAGYVSWLGLGIGDVVANHWGWGLLGAVMAGSVLTVLAMHQPAGQRLHGRRLVGAMVWEGAVYGTAEGVLLSALPPFIAWQMVESLGWSGAAGVIARWGLPLVAAAAVVVVHHLGYWNFRNRILVPVTLGLSLLSLGFLLTASWITPAFGHVIAHGGLLMHGSEMPPVERPVEPSVSTEEHSPPMLRAA